MPTPINQAMGAQSGDQSIPSGPGALVKVCGITEPAEIDLLASRQVDFVGLWYGVKDGPVDLPLDEWRDLAAAAAAAEGLHAVLVTFLKDADAIGEALADSGANWVQLHGYQTPGTVRKVKGLDPDVRVIKVLHISGQECVEEPLIGSYEKAGVDVFLFDPVSAEGQVGSTGQTLDAAYALTLADKLERPFLLAGGLSADNVEPHAELTAHPRYIGIDVDTNARGADGKVSAEKVEGITRAWRGEDADA